MISEEEFKKMKDGVYIINTSRGELIDIEALYEYVKNGKVAESDTINFTLSDKYGNWNGSGLGKLFQSTATIRQNIRPNEFSEVIVWHNMRCDTVTNITDLGLILTPHQNK